MLNNVRMYTDVAELEAALKLASVHWLHDLDNPSSWKMLQAYNARVCMAIEHAYRLGQPGVHTYSGHMAAGGKDGAGDGAVHINFNMMVQHALDNHFRTTSIYRYPNHFDVGVPSSPRHDVPQALFIRNYYQRRGGVWVGPAKGPLSPIRFSLSQILGQDCFWWVDLRAKKPSLCYEQGLMCSGVVRSCAAAACGTRGIEECQRFCGLGETITGICMDT